MSSPKDRDKDGHEQDFFDGIDTTLVGLASKLGDEEKKAPWLRALAYRDPTASFRSGEKCSKSAQRPASPRY